jgi:GMP synthase (glutamine-hydrolysing)
MRIACLQHVPFEGPGSIGEWAMARGHSFRTVRLYEGQSLPQTDDFDLLVIMGGPMSVHDEADYEWLRPEKALVAASLREEKFVLGVCLGSQILAEVLGSSVYRNAVREIGWFPVRTKQGVAGSGCFAGIPPEMPVLHWHGETYGLPPGCAYLAESEACAMQAFEHPSALGLQFHFEVTADGLSDLIRNCGHEIGDGAWEQAPEAIAAGERTHGAAARKALYSVLDAISVKVAGFVQ